MVTQSVSKEDRQKGIKGAILGNAKIVGQRQVQSPQEPASQPRYASEKHDEGDDLAF